MQTRSRFGDDPWTAWFTPQGGFAGAGGPWKEAEALMDKYKNNSGAAIVVAIKLDLPGSTTFVRQWRSQ